MEGLETLASPAHNQYPLPKPQPLQTMGNTWQQLDAVMLTAGSMKALVGTREDALVPCTISQRLTADMQHFPETAQMLEQWMSGLAGDPLVTPSGPVFPVTPPDPVPTETAPGPGLPPLPHLSLPPDSGLLPQARLAPREVSWLVRVAEARGGGAEELLCSP